MDKEREIRLRKIEKLKLKGYKQYEIAKKLEVSEVTISKDVKYLNKRYAKLVAKNPAYLEKRVEKVLEWLDKYELIVKQLYDLKDGNVVVNERIHDIVDRFVPELNPATHSKEEVKLRKVERRTFTRQLTTLAKTNTSDYIQVLREVRQTMAEQTKILQLVTGNKTYIQQNMISIDKIELIMKKLQYIIEKFVPVNKRKEVYGLLKTLQLED